MFLLTKPNPQSVQAFLSAQKNDGFSYAEVGHSRNGAPRGYTCDHNRVQLGIGKDVFNHAITALEHWKMFEMRWIELCWPDTPIEPGSDVAVLVSHFGFWSLNGCRIVYVVKEGGPVEKFGFAYGTLSDHGEIGEERFTVEYDTGNQSVWYDLLAFSRPGSVARLAYPFARALQKRFARDSKAAMQKAAQIS